MVKEVVQKDSPILRKKCKTITDFRSVQETIIDLIDTIEYLKTTHTYKRGIGLAAPQIGEAIRVSVAEDISGKRYTLINPEIIAHSKVKIPIREGCISFFQFRGMTPRYYYVKVKALDKKGKEFTVEAAGDFAMLLQHEIDHLNGILYFEHLKNKENDLFTIAV